MGDNEAGVWSPTAQVKRQHLNRWREYDPLEHRDVTSLINMVAYSTSSLEIMAFGSVPAKNVSLNKNRLARSPAFPLWIIHFQPWKHIWVKREESVTTNPNKSLISTQNQIYGYDNISYIHY